jgi:glycosyltransferase involved in cell wall biosynthesis
VRILFDYRPALRERTGVGAYMHETARALAQTATPEESVVLFSSSWKDRLAPDAVPPLGTLDRRIPVRWLNRLWHRAEWPSVELLTGRRWDIAQAAHPILIPSRRAAGVVTLHDLDFLDHPERTSAEIRRDYPELAARHAVMADQVIAVSTYTARGVETRFGVNPTRITVCPPGAPDWEARPRLPLNGHILFLGTLEPRKNLDVLLEAYTRLLARRAAVPPLVLAGRIDPSASGIVERAGRPPLAGRVQLPGYVSETARRQLFDDAVVFVLPSHTEGFGIPAVEAMKAGVPVIAADRGALPETVGDAGARFDPGDAEQLTHLLDDIVSSRERQQHMADAGLRHVARFTWRHTANRTREAWRLALEHRSARG